MANTHIISFASWNLLYDDRPDERAVPPQAERIDSFRQAFKKVTVTFDILGLYEVHGTVKDHGGLLLAKDLNLPVHGFSPHHRNDEAVFMATRKPFTTPQPLVMDPNHRSRMAMITESQNIAVAAAHPSHHPLRSDLRMRQFSALIRSQIDRQCGVIMGDLNCMAWQKPRRLLEAHGYQSVLGQLGLLGRSTFPAYYKTADGRPLPPGLRHLVERAVNLRGYSIDDIYVKGDHKVLAGGFLEGKSDHLGVWATIELT
jgi:endonuclease/exonuclease/phosphatase family metal-dependent hydrolase